jgi:hypothetical protein
MIKCRNVVDPEVSGKQKSKILNRKCNNEPSCGLSLSDDKIAGCKQHKLTGKELFTLS